MHPIFLNTTYHTVRRDSLLFCFCGLCQKQVRWQPLGGWRFHAQCCNVTYDAEPIDINLHCYQVVVKKNDMKNVVKLGQVKEKMTFAGG